MTIRQKTLTTLACTLVALVGVLYGVLSGVIGAGFGAVEQRDARLNMARVQEAWAAPLQNMAEKLSDWAVWDDTYRFVLDRNEAYVQANQTGAPFMGMKIDLMMFIGTDGVPVRTMAWNRADDAETAPPQGVIDAHFGPGSPNIAHDSLDSVKNGVVFTDGAQPMLFCSMPILDSNGEGPSHGTLLFGAWFDAERQQKMENLTKLDLAFAVEGERGEPGDFAAAASGLGAAGSIVLREASDRTISGYTRFADVYGKRHLVVRADIPREVHAQATATLRWLLLALVVVSLAFSGVIVTLLERLVLKRVTRLAAGVSHITESFDFSGRVDSSGTDEISGLSHSVNGLIAAVEQVVYASLQSETAANAAAAPPAPEAVAVPEYAGQEVR